MVRVYVESLGCKLNQCERDAMAQQFAGAGHTVVFRPEDADVCVVNTCAVTRTAAAKSRRRFHHLRRANPSVRLVAAGCSATLGEGDLDADFEVGNDRKEELVSLVEAQIEAWALDSARQDAGSKRALLPRTRPMVKIQDGCDNACTYCIVHVLRGRQRSRPRGEILSEIAELVRQGYHEVVLTGVHVGSYGRDRGESLGGLVRSILSGACPDRLRLSSIEPWDLEPAFLDLWQDRRLCRHLHLPLQSGCDTTLARMNRHYTAAHYADLVARARDAISGLAVTTDVIAGFPGETEEDFAASVAFVELMGFARIHVFVYSERPGTPAAGMSDQVPLSVRRSRAGLLREIARRSGEAFRRGLVGCTMPVLWETRLPDGRWSGLTDNYVRVFAESADRLHNTVRAARLSDLEPGGIRGMIV